MYKAKVKYNGEHYFCGEIVRGSKIDKLKDGSTWLYDDEEIDWYDKEQDKWAICYDIEDKEIAYESGKKIKSVPFNVYFATEQDCERAIKTIGEDRIKKYYFDIED